METLVLASRLLHGQMGRGMFVTCLYGVLDTQTHEVSYVSAGHCPPILFGENGAKFLPAGGKALGMFPEGIFTASLKPRTVSLHEDEGFLLYTDGLIEAMNVAGEQLGSDTVRTLMHRLGTEKETQITHALLGLVDKHRNGHSLSDDLTLLSLRRGHRQVRPVVPETIDSHNIAGGSRP